MILSSSNQVNQTNASHNLHGQTMSQSATTNNVNSAPSNPMQITNYITWINSHLKKRPGVRMVENLQTDLCNGVILTHLIEIISGQVLSDINLNPRTHLEYKENIEKILRFMQQNAVKMHQTSYKEIAEGNLKSIMRLILALAAHFKPSNVQPYSAVLAKQRQTKATSSSSVNNPTTTKLAPIGFNKRSSSTNNVNIASNPATSNSPIGSSPCSSSNNVNTNATYVVDSAANSHNVNKNQTRNLDSMTHLVQAACVSLADVRRYKNENFNAKYQKRTNMNNSPSIKPYNETFTVNKATNLSLLSPPSNNSNNNTTLNSFNATNTTIVPLASSTVLIPSTSSCTVQAEHDLKERNMTYVCERKVTDEVNDEPREHQTNSERTLENEAIKNNEQEQQVLANPELMQDVQTLKKVLLNLQSLLMSEELDMPNVLMPITNKEAIDRREEAGEANANNSSSSSSSDDFPLANLPKDEQIVILRSKIQQLEIICDDLRTELNQAKSESMNKVGVECGLKQRLNEQDNSILEMKNEQLNLNIHNQQLLKEKEQMSKKLMECQNQMNKMRQDMLSRDDLIERLKAELDELHKEREQTRFVCEQVKQVNDTLEIVQEKENALCHMIASTDRKLTIIDNKLATSALVHSAKAINGDEINTLKEILNKMRANLNVSNQSQQLVNNLEQTVFDLIEKSNLNCMSNNQQQHNHHTSTSSSISSSSANSPAQSQSPTSSLHSSSSSISSFNNQNNTVKVQLNNITSTQRALDMAKQDHNGGTEIPIINSESNVKKIISRLLSQNNAISSQTNQTVPLHQTSKVLRNATNTTNTLLTISSTMTTSTTVPHHISGNSHMTKCVYYLEKNPTPFMSTIFKDIDSITLRDFKECIKLKPGTYRFHFKSQDPEFGIVKEEISTDNKLLPNFENRIVAWIHQETDI